MLSRRSRTASSAKAWLLPNFHQAEARSLFIDGKREERIAREKGGAEVELVEAPSRAVVG
jgi:hypothetical protein